METFKKCKVKDCKNKHDSKGYCGKHYMQLKLHGKILERTRYNLNKIAEKKYFGEFAYKSKL